MFEKPKSGWITFESGNFKGSCSFINPFTFKLLESLNEHILTKNSVCVTVDEEGSDFNCVFTEYSNVYIIINIMFLQITALDLKPFEFAKELLKDIEENLTDWELFVLSEEGYKEKFDDSGEKEYILEEFHERLNLLKYTINREEKRK